MACYLGGVGKEQNLVVFLSKNRKQPLQYLDEDRKEHDKKYKHLSLKYRLQRLKFLYANDDDSSE